MIRIVTKTELVGPWAMPYPSEKFRQNPFTTFSVIRRTDRQTDRSENITSFSGGNDDVDDDNPINCLHDGPLLSIAMSLNHDIVTTRKEIYMTQYDTLASFCCCFLCPISLSFKRV